MKEMNPKQWIRYVKKLEKNNLAICDGVSAEFHIGLFDWLFPLFLLSGMGIFLVILAKWEWIKSKLGIK